MRAVDDAEEQNKNHGTILSLRSRPSGSPVVRCDFVLDFLRTETSVGKYITQQKTDCKSKGRKPAPYRVSPPIRLCVR